MVYFEALVQTAWTFYMLLKVTPQVSAEYQPKNSDQLKFLLASEGYPHKFFYDLQSINWEIGTNL